MSRNRDRKSRFDGNPSDYSNRSYDSMPYYSQNDIFSPRDIGPPPLMKTPEQLAFDAEFSKWEKSFEDWKMSFAQHPDRMAYKQYEKKFLDVREKLLAKRKQIYCKSNTLTPFENQLSAADAMANSILSKFGVSNDMPMHMPSNSMDDFRGGAGRDEFRGGMNRDNFRGSMGRDDRGRSGGRDDFRGGRDDFRGGMGGGREDFRGGRDDRGRSGGRDDFRGGMRRDDRRGGGGGGGGGRDGGRRDDRRGGGGGMGRDDRRGGGGGMGRNDRNDRRGGFGGGNRFDEPKGRSIQKPTEKQIAKDLKRNDVYPNIPWKSCSLEERPPLVGKRAKKKNAKINNVIDRKNKIASGEILEEPAAVEDNQQNQNELLPFAVRLEKMFDDARKAECPKLLPGSAKRRLKNVKAKKEEERTEEDNSFLAYVDFVTIKRAKYFEERDSLEKAQEQQKNSDEKIDSVQISEEKMDVVEAPQQ